jgi:hypothetical protein
MERHKMLFYFCCNYLRRYWNAPRKKIVRS